MPVKKKIARWENEFFTASYMRRRSPVVSAHPASLIVLYTLGPFFFFFLPRWFFFSILFLWSPLEAPRRRIWRLGSWSSRGSPAVWLVDDVSALWNAASWVPCASNIQAVLELNFIFCFSHTIIHGREEEHSWSQVSHVPSEFSILADTAVLPDVHSEAQAPATD
jgi:hypothetical protein